MNTNLSRFINAFADLRVIVIGEAMLDSYLEGFTGRLSREAPVPVVTLSHRRDLPGGAANTAVNVRSLAAQVLFLSVVGDDQEGGLLRRAIEEQGVSTAHILNEPGRSTLAKHRVIAASQMLLRYDQGSTTPISAKSEQQLINRFADLVTECDAVIVSDYDCGVLTPRVIQSIADLQRQTPRIVVVDSKRLSAYEGAGATAVKPNYDEAVQLLSGQMPESSASAAQRVDAIAAHGMEILNLTGAHIAAVTIDTEGAFVFERNRPPYRTYARPARHSRATGAGDTFTSAFALALAADAHTPAAAELASAAAAIVVSKEGTATCSAEELQEYVAAGDTKHAADLSRLCKRVEGYRQQGRRIVYTNGCFDILHRGHITYLNQAKRLGDVLIVGVNSDASVHRLKGAGRPINTLEDRSQILAALSCVDHIIAFDEDTSDTVIEAIRPNLYVKGGDYSWKLLPEASLVERLGGVVHILPFVADHSTAGIIERIRDAREATDAEHLAANQQLIAG